MTKSYCEVYLVRHGETEWNSMGRIQGHTDIPLNSQGLNQAADLAKKLDSISFSAVFSSDLLRAKQTAECLVQSRQLPLIETPALRERWAGSLEGRPAEELDLWMKKFFLTSHADFQEQHVQTAWHPDLETLASVFSRAHAFLSNQACTYLDHTILAVTHGGVIRSFLDHLAFIPRNKWIISNCGFIKLKLTSTEMELAEMNGVTHKPF